MPAHGPADAVRGTIVAIGGGEDKIKERHVLHRLVALAGRHNARIGIIPTASAIPLEMGALYTRVFGEMGASSVVLPVRTREEASDPGILAALEECTAVFMTGGDQLRLVSTLGGTPIVQAMRRLNARGVPIAGTSAGAGAICQHMIARGRSGQVLNQKMVSLAPGLGLTNRIVVDQHFSQRHRMGRLITAVALNPFLVGVGIDEDTAAALGPDNRLTVWGRGSVTVVDGTRITHTDIADVETNRPASVLGVSVHVMTKGYSYDLRDRVAARPVPEVESPAAPPPSAVPSPLPPIASPEKP